MRFIDADALKKAIQDNGYSHYYEIFSIIDNAPTVKEPIQALARIDEKGNVKIEPLRTQGEWIDDSPIGWKCSCCGYGVQRWNNTEFCPKCGADMRGGAE